jgi:hypothetical protein
VVVWSVVADFCGYQGWGGIPDSREQSQADLSDGAASGGHHRHGAYQHGTHSLSPTQLPEEKRLALIAKLNKSIPTIVMRCNSYPASRYVRFLPEEIRVLL